MNNEHVSNKIKIGIDARMWSQTGIGRYVRNISINLQKIDKKNNYVLFVLKKDKEKVEKVIENKNWKIKVVDIKWHSISEQIRFPRVINKENLDLMHFPYQKSIPILYRKTYILTIHDLISHHFLTGKASTGPIWLYGFKMLGYKILINLETKNARKIIAISNTTKNEIFDHLIADKNKVEVVYEAADDLALLRSSNNDLGEYFLYVGNVYPHKNVDTLIKAYKEVAKKKEVKLVFVGGNDYFYKRLKSEVISETVDKKIVFFENVSDEKLVSLYSNAVCLVRPSLMEGFSLPPLEAIRMNCLVIASDIPVHREIFKDNLIYFKSNDLVDLREKMLYVLSLDKKKKDKILNKAKEIEKLYSWKKTAAGTLSIYESSLGI